MNDLQEDFYGFPDGKNNRDVQNELFLGTDWGNFIQGDRNGINGFSDDLIYARSGLALNQLETYPLAIKTANRAQELEPNNPHPLVAAAISY